MACLFSYMALNTKPTSPKLRMLDKASIIHTTDSSTWHFALENCAQLWSSILKIHPTLTISTWWHFHDSNNSRLLYLLFAGSLSLLNCFSSSCFFSSGIYRHQEIISPTSLPFFCIDRQSTSCIGETEHSLRSCRLHDFPPISVEIWLAALRFSLLGLSPSWN